MYAAYFACYLRGKSRIEGTNKWITFDDTRNENILPDTYYNVKVEGLDFSNTIVNNTGLDNLSNLDVYFYFFYSNY